MFGAEGSELLKELKESGVIDQFEKELEKMLHDQKDNEVKTDESATPKKGLYYFYLNCKFRLS